MIAVALLLDGIGILWLGLVLLVLCGIGTVIVAWAVKRKELQVPKVIECLKCTKVRSELKFL